MFFLDTLMHIGKLNKSSDVSDLLVVIMSMWNLIAELRQKSLM